MKMREVKLNLFDVQTTGQASLSAEMKTFYENTLIDMAEPQLVHDRFADKYPIPKNNGKTIELRKYSSLAKATTPLVEGVTPAGNMLSVTAKTATVNQYGDYIKLSDMLELTAIDNNVVQSTKLLGSQSGRTLDTITREIVNAGTNVIYACGKDGGEVLSRDELSKDCVLSVDTVFRAAAQLESMNADGIDGESYVAIIHPYAAYDLMRSAEWVDVHKYADPESIFKGEIGSLGNVRFVKSTEAKIFADESCPQFYQLTSDANFLEGKDYYTKSGDSYQKASVSAGLFPLPSRTAVAVTIPCSDPVPLIPVFLYLLGLSYMQIGQENSFGWPAIQLGLPYQIRKVAELAAAGKVVVETMGETGRKFKARHRENVPQTQVALENWSGEDYRSVWYNSKHYRATSRIGH